MFKLFHLIKTRIVNIHKSTVKKYNSRLDTQLHNYCSFSPEKVCELLDFYIDKTDFKKCFFNSVFMRDVFPYITHGTTFYNCSFEINIENNFSIYDLGLHTYVNCNFYIKNFDKFRVNILEQNNLYSVKFVLNALIENNSRVFNMSYFEHLLKKHNNNLKDLRKEEYNGLSLYGLDLSNVLLPTDENFFKNIAFSSVEGCTLPSIDFNNYNTFGVTFKNTTFNESSVLSRPMLAKGLSGCILPIIDFEKYNEKHYINLYNCTFHSKTAFPTDELFFIKNEIRACIFPNNDYGKYIVQENTLKDCYFGNEAILPEILTENEYINCFNSLKNIPNRYLNFCAKYLELKKPEEFINKYKDRLTEQEIYLIYKRHLG